MEVPFKIISIEHFVSVAVCVSFIVLFPRLFKDKDQAILKILRVSIVVLILTFQILDFYKVVYLFGDPWKTALPLHLCDFSAISIAGYLLTGNKHLFNFASSLSLKSRGKKTINETQTATLTKCSIEMSLKGTSIPGTLRDYRLGFN